MQYSVLYICTNKNSVLNNDKAVCVLPHSLFGKGYIENWYIDTMSFTMSGSQQKSKMTVFYKFISCWCECKDIWWSLYLFTYFIKWHCIAKTIFVFQLIWIVLSKHLLQNFCKPNCLGYLRELHFFAVNCKDTFW